MPAVVNDRCPMVQTAQKTVEIYGPDHRDFTVDVQLKYGPCPCCVRRAGSTVAFVVETAEIHSCRSSSIPHFMAVAVRMRLFARFTGIFRTPSSWTSSAGWRDAGSLLSATQLGAS